MGLKKNILAFFIIGALGTLGHFIYDLSGNMMLLGLVFPINESVWEHLKLVFFPSLIYFFIEYMLISKKAENYIPASISSIFKAMAFIVISFYTLNGIFGKVPDFINIIIYYVSVILMLVCRNRSIEYSKQYSNITRLLLYFLTVVFTALFFIFSFIPPNLNIFKDPTK
ncbi:MAG: hypothetical protein IKT38_00620 [Clostridia bacterium]|nr:hypothetical protein [Clostridia bacterium]